MESGAIIFLGIFVVLSITILILLLVNVFGFSTNADLYVKPKLKQSDKLRPIVVGLGLPRTATSSLSDALRLLGWKPSHFPINLKKRRKAFLKRRNAFVDLTMMNLRPKEIQEMFWDKNVKYIYTYRDIHKWKKSLLKLKKLFNRWKRSTLALEGIQKNLNSMFIDFENDSIETFRNEYEQEMRECIPKQDLLEIDLIKAEDKWKDICKFLRCDRPQAPFPHSSEMQVSIKQFWLTNY